MPAAARGVVTLMDTGVPAGEAQWSMSGSTSCELSAGRELEAIGPSTWLLVRSGTVEVRSVGERIRLDPGDAALLRQAAAYTIAAVDAARVVVADLRPGRDVPTPGIVVSRGFAERHSGVAALLGECPLTAAHQRTYFGSGYAHLVGGAMLSALEDRAPGDPGVRRAVDAIAEDPAREWNLCVLARIAYVGRSSLVERFRAETGMSPMQYVRRTRIAEARRLLRHSDASVGDVGSAVGYGSSAAFVRAFTADVGVPPGRWRCLA
ncbi:AraC family transcriptional regulator [Tsukamurella sp. 8F]|uniref:helix-turn-helix domain-containing protein n=1 Tax=unclassified Tsukamurella TaxID=2633480 RepID=UPI0023B908DA|nr:MULTISPECIES: AraC family transcriptional regulator [unclassified Tsukamurella]MDF0530637.1 AraC family transcriptional regulator [Tsukamurella sp. 8J]MDF0587838.1 AraC family transcriptional regulator [Tsukamurella sp. 8F]